MATSWQALLDAHPAGPRSDESNFWVEYLAENPDMLHRLLADLYRATYGVDRPPTLDELWDLMATQRFATDEFGPAVLDLLASKNQSVRWLAQQVGSSHTQIRHYLTGRRPIVSLHDAPGSMRRIEAVAGALRVHPSFFQEWRRLWIMMLLDSAFIARPALSINVFQRFSGLSGGENARSKGRS